MNMLLNIIGYILLFFLIELFLYVYCILLTIQEEETSGININTLFEDFKDYNESASVSNIFKSINVSLILICLFLTIFGVSIFFITKS